MAQQEIPGLGIVQQDCESDLIDLSVGGDGGFSVGSEGVQRIVTPLDRKVELIVYADRTLVYVKSAMGCPAMYPLSAASFEPPARAVLMDLDGTSVHSEAFWVWIIQKSIARLMGDESFTLEPADEPHVSGHSVSEHLQYCIDKYCPDKKVEKAREHYFEITAHEMGEVLAGRGRADAFVPSPGLKEFLLKLKENNVRIGLVTSGLYEKAWPEIVAAFRTLKMGDPLDFYDAIISAGFAIRKGQVGTLGELAPKPHPWLYAETARVGLGIDPSRRDRVIGMEDSSAGVISIRLAGFAAIGVAGGNIASGGCRPFVNHFAENLLDSLPLILGK